MANEPQAANVSKVTAPKNLDLDELRRKVEARLPGVHKILADMRDSGDPDRIADGAFLLGMLDEMSDYVGLLREQDEEWMEPFDRSGIEWHEALPSPYTYQRSDFSKLVAAVHEYECEVLRLRGALERIYQQGRGPHVGIAREALDG